MSFYLPVHEIKTVIVNSDFHFNTSGYRLYKSISSALMLRKFTPQNADIWFNPKFCTVLCVFHNVVWHLVQYAKRKPIISPTNHFQETSISAFLIDWMVFMTTSISRLDHIGWDCFVYSIPVSRRCKYIECHSTNGNDNIHSYAPVIEYSIQGFNGKWAEEKERKLMRNYCNW